jgi:hypothetical protein
MNQARTQNSFHANPTLGLLALNPLGKIKIQRSLVHLSVIPEKSFSLNTNIIGS